MPRKPPVNEEQEREANYFAMCLLVPENLLRAEVKKRGDEIDLFGDDVKELAKKFQVTETLMALRLEQVFGLSGKI